MFYDYVKGVGINRKETPKIWERLDSAPWYGGLAELQNKPLPVCATTYNLVVLRERVKA